MIREIFISTTFVKDKSKVSKALNELQKINFKKVELGSNHRYEKKLNYIKKKKFDYLVHNYFPVPKKDFVINIASLNKTLRERSIAQIKKSIIFSKKINAKYYTFHPGFLSDPLGARLNSKFYDFNWKKGNVSKKIRIEAWNNMIASLKIIQKFAHKNEVKVCIETEGSVKAKDHLLMQKPVEFKKLIKIFKEKIGINLNLAHLNLASKSFKFDKSKFLNLIKKNLKLVEISHNYGTIDSHKPLKKNGWYIKFLKKIPTNVPIIIELRNSNIKQIKSSINIIKNEIKIK